MDPVAVPALAAILSRLLDGVLGEAGKRTWDGLISLVRKDSNGDAEPETTPAAWEDEQADPARAQEIAEDLGRRARENPEFAAALQQWQLGTIDLLREHGQVQGDANVITGSVHGPSVQARDVSGSINIGGDDRTG